MKDATKDAHKDAPDDKSDVEENQKIKDVDREDACKECTKKMTVVGQFRYVSRARCTVTFTRLKPIKRVGLF